LSRNVFIMSTALTSSWYARSLIEASLDPLVTINAEGKITDVNKAAEEVTGCPRKQLIGSDFCDYFTEPEKARAGYQQAFIEGSVRDYPLAIRHENGKITDVLYNATVFRNEAGEIQGVFAAVRDVTAWKEAEEKLRATWLYARRLLDASLDPMLTISADGKITDVNQATEYVTGFSRKQLIGSDFSNYFTNPEAARKGYRKVFTRGFVKDYELAIRHKTGKITYVLYNASVYRNETGEIQGVFAAARDITERKQLDEAVKKQAELIDLSPDAIIVKDPNDVITFWSLGAEKLYGYTKAQAIGQKTQALLKAKSRQPIETIEAHLKKDGKWSGEMLHHTKFGRELAIQSYWLAKFDENHEIAEVFESNVDITERKTAERLAAIGATAGMVGHDIRNPLQTITGEIFLAKGILASFPESENKACLKETMDIIEEQTVYVNKIISDLQDYAKPLTPKIEATDFRAVVQSVLATLQIPRKVEIEHLVSPDFPHLMVDKLYLQRILQNLASNAVQAMPNGGKLVIKAIMDDSRAVITVEDTGDGIPEEVRGNLFQPLITTKSRGQGFGLAVVKRMTEGLGGTVSFESEVGKGTKFMVILPQNP
jgi:PAS domain S-box-containing protein